VDVRSSVARGDAEELARFRRLLTATIVATFVLIVIGGIVRVSDSGLGCGPAGSGTHGWPLCDGGLLPAASGESVIEFSHRIAAGLVGVLIAICAWRAIRRLRAHRALVRGSLAAGALVLAQAALGGLTVERGLEEELVAAHLGLAMLLIGLLIVLRRGASPAEPPPGEDVRGLRTLSALAGALVLATIVAGGYVAGTEREGTPSEPPVGQAHVACGEQFPGCNGAFMPFGQSRLTDIQLVHRAFMYLAAIAVFALIALAVRRRVASRALLIAGALLAAQILLGALNVWLGKHAGLILAHLALATLLWSTLVHAAIPLLAGPQPARRRLRQAEAAGAAA
jgi:heme A synthase